MCDNFDGDGRTEHDTNFGKRLDSQLPQSECVLSLVVHSEITEPITFQFNNLLNNVLNFNSRGRKMKYCLV